MYELYTYIFVKVLDIMTLLNKLYAHHFVYHCAFLCI